MMGDIKFLDTLRAYDKDNIPQVTSIKILIVLKKQTLKYFIHQYEKFEECNESKQHSNN